MKKLLVLAFLFLCVVDLHAQLPSNAVTGQITAATTNATCVGTATPSGGAVDQPINGITGAIGISVTGTWVGTLNIQFTVDHGKTWTAIGSTFTANQQSVITTSGYSDVCVFASAFTSGTAIVSFITSTPAAIGAGASSGSSSQVQGCGAADAAAACNPVLVGGVDNAGNVQELPVADAGTTVPSQTLLVGGKDSAGLIQPIPLTNGTLNTTQQVAGADGVSNTIAAFSSNAGTFPPVEVTPFYFNGLTWDRGITCSNTSTFNVVSTTTQVIAASGSTKIRICSFDINPATATAGTTDIVYGTGTNCGTGTTTLTGAYTLPAAAVVDITPSTLSATSPLTTPASQAVCVRAVTSTVNGFIVWEQH